MRLKARRFLLFSYVYSLLYTYIIKPLSQKIQLCQTLYPFIVVFQIVEMPTGKDFSTALKKLFFRVIEFVENEKTGLVIPLSNTTARIMALLDISKGTVF